MSPDIPCLELCSNRTFLAWAGGETLAQTAVAAVPYEILSTAKSEEN